MKTKGLSFLEAVRALDDGKCEKIQNIGGVCYEKNLGGIIVFTGTGGGQKGILLASSVFLDEWSLVGVKQKITGKVKWEKYNEIVYPIYFETDDSPAIFSDLLNKPEMKITLEWTE